MSYMFILSFIVGFLLASYFAGTKNNKEFIGFCKTIAGFVDKKNKEKDSA